MSKRVIAIILSLSLVLCPFVAKADSISAQSAIVLDADSGTILYEKNAYSTQKMASTTKIMTCLIACESNKLNDVVTITEDMICDAYGTLLYLKAGDKITLYDLVKGAMLVSGNDCANAIAVYLTGTIKSFVSVMNKRAKEIGMDDTTFVTPSGLDEGNHHSTAYDMAILSVVALKNDFFASVCNMSSDEISINDKRQTIYNHNKLLSFDDHFVGVKTGFTEKAGRCLVSAYDYYGNKIITVTLNAPNDWEDHKLLVEYAKKKYQKFEDSIYVQIPVVGAQKDSVKCKIKYSILSLHKVSAYLYYYPFVYSPISSGEIVGYAKIVCNERIIDTVDIIVFEEK